jgi:hypothetical protein
MLKNIVENLIPTGIMKYLVENFYTKKRRFETPVAGPKVLTLDDLLFGFKIWFGSFLLALLAFFGENFTRLKKRNRKIKFAKVHPLEESSEVTSKGELTSDLIGIFRKVQNKETDDEEQPADCNQQTDDGDQPVDCNKQADDGDQPVDCNQQADVILNLVATSLHE